MKTSMKIYFFNIIRYQTIKIVKIIVIFIVIIHIIIVNIGNII